MANIPENTNNPILRPVTRLETTTKVFGGEYIPDDAQQRGISNLQAIELAERDQYILSRVGQPYVPASGDIPAKAGIAGLDTSGRVPKAQLPTDTVYTEETQTLKNKTLSSTYNTLDIDGGSANTSIKCTPISPPNSQTINFTKEESLKLNVDNIVITLGTAPYEGFEVVVTCVDSINRGYVLFNSITNTTNCVCLQKRVTLTFVYSTSRWALKSGAFLVIYDNDVANAPIKDSSLDPSDPGYRYHPNDWASGFGYGDFTIHYNSGTYGVSYYGIPRWCTVVRVSYMTASRGTAIAMTDDTINPMTYVKCLYDGGWTSSWMRVVTNDEIQTLTNKTINFANNTLTGVASTSTSQTLTNKTIDANSNTLKNVVTSKNISNCITEIPQDITLTLSSGTLTLKAGSKVYVPLGFEADGTTPKFVTYTTSRDWAHTTSADGVYMVFAANNGGIASRPLANCVSGAGATTTLGFAYNTTTNNIDNYNESGTASGNDFSFPLCVATVSGGAISSIDQVFNGMGYIGSILFALPGLKGLSPNGRNTDGTLKSIERSIATVSTVNCSTDGARTLHFGASIYDDRSTLYVYDEGLNFCVRTSDKAQHSLAEIATYTVSSGAISNFKPKTAFHAVDWNDVMKGTGVVHTVSSFETGFSGTLNWVVQNGMCTVSLFGIITSSTGNNKTVTSTALPKAKVGMAQAICNNQSQTIQGIYFIEGNSTTLKAHILATGTGYGGFSYPVADNWVES